MTEPELRDYLAWHRAYDDSDSDLSWRLRRVQEYVRDALDERAGQIRILSLCAGDGRDVIEVLATRPDSERASVTLLELHPELAARARSAVAAADLDRVEVRTVDAGLTDSYVGAVPADLVLLVGIFGNISDADLWATIDAAPQLCNSGAVVIWSRGLDQSDLNDQVRARFGAAGFEEFGYDTFGGAALGAVRRCGPGDPLMSGQRLFTFLR